MADRLALGEASAAILNVPQNLRQPKPMARKGAGNSSRILALELQGEGVIAYRDGCG
jgi:hypothetical protein